jgi:MFS family permease
MRNSRSISTSLLSWSAGLTSDGWLILLACGVRTLAFGSLSVILALYLKELNFGTEAIGAVFSAALVGGALLTIGVTSVADRIGRRRMLMFGSGLMAASGAVFALTDFHPLIVVTAIIGTITPSARDDGAFLAIEQAALPDTTTPEHRTALFAAYNLIAFGAGAIGALMIGAPSLLGMSKLDGYHLLLWGYVASAAITMLVFSRLSARIEVHRAPGPFRPSIGIHKSRGLVARLCVLFALDSFGGALVVQGLIAYWFTLRFGEDVATPVALGAIFFTTSMLSAVSFLVAVPLSKKIGLLNTMVFTHLPSNLLLASVAFMPSLPWAALALFTRHLLSQMDVPARQSYIMAVVEPDERSAVAGVTQVARVSGSAIAPAFSGLTMAVPSLGLPFLLSGGLKVIYDLAIFFSFRAIKPPEEQKK